MKKPPSLLEMTSFGVIIGLMAAGDTRAAPWMAVAHVAFRMVSTVAGGVRMAMQGEPPVGTMCAHRLACLLLVAMGFVFLGDPGSGAFWLLVNLCIESARVVMLSLNPHIEQE